MLTHEPQRILVVCIGNVCRSPLAERLLRARLADAGLAAAYDVASAGTRGLAGSPMEPQAAQQLRALGGDPEGFVARRLTGPMVADADLVLTATVALRRQVLDEAPSALRRIFTLRELAGLVGDTPPGEARGLVAEAAARRGRLVGTDLDVPDPMGGGVVDHERSAALIAAAVDAIVAALAQEAQRAT